MVYWLLNSPRGFVVLLVAFCALGLVLYFVPALIAFGLDLPGWPGAFVFNLAFGWTVLGWIIALGIVLRQVHTLRLSERESRDPSAHRKNPPLTPSAVRRIGSG